MSTRSVRVSVLVVSVLSLVAVVVVSATATGAGATATGAGATATGAGSTAKGDSSPPKGASSAANSSVPAYFRALGLTIPTGYSSDGSAANQAATHQDASSLLAKVGLPSGAGRLASEPSGDHGYLKPLEALEGDSAHAVAHGWWQVPASPSDVIMFVKAHPPKGAKQSGTGGSANGSGSSALSVSFQSPAVPGVLGYRTLEVTATSLPGGDTGVLVESQSDWVALRPSAERIPSGVRRIELTSAALGQPSLVVRVTRRSQVRAVVRLINSLPIAQPVVYMCPALRDPRVIKIAFQGSHGGALAALNYMDYRPWLSPGIACKTVGVTIAGQHQDPLLGGGFLQTLTRLLGRQLV